MPRNRSQEARSRGRRLCAFDIALETDKAITDLQTYYISSGKIPGCTRTQAVETALQDAAKKVRKFFQKEVDKD